MNQDTVAELLAAAFAANDVRHIFGVPGGGSSLDIIQAAAEKGIDFVLTRTESAAVMMAAATAEVSGKLGVALTTKGPGTASAVNGVAYASLDRSPVMLITGMPMRFSKGSKVTTSLVEPELDMAMTTSLGVIMPISPWLASPG